MNTAVKHSNTPINTLKPRMRWPCCKNGDNTPPAQAHKANEA